jgi:hypothetical protein
VAWVLFTVTSLAIPCVAAEDAGNTPILVHHRFDPNVAGPTTVTVAAFEDQLAWLARHN